MDAKRGAKRPKAAEEQRGCGGCLPGASCTVDSDCQSSCVDGTCAKASCSDGRADGFETDVDCGAACGVGCARGQGCANDDDCATGSCGVNDLHQQICVIVVSG